VTHFHNHINRDGFFVDAAITKASAATVHRDTSFAGTITGNSYASPLYVENGPGGKGAFYVATESNNVYALDETTGKPLWQKTIGTPAGSTGAGCGNINPIGITGTPAIDLATRLIIFNAATASSGGGAIVTHTIRALSIDDGTEKWSVDVSKLTDGHGTTFSPQPQNQRGAVLIVNGVAYVVYGGHYGDCGTYHGWVVGVPIATGTGAKAWATQSEGAGIWGCGGAASDGSSVFVTTGNATNGPQTWSESEGLFRLDPGPSFTQLNEDFFAPSNWQALDQGDVDMSGSGPLVIDAPEMIPSTLVMAQGKDGNLYLLNRANLGGVGAMPLGQLNVLSGEISNGGAWAHIPQGTYVVVRPNQGGGGVNCPNNTSGDLVAVKLDPKAAQKMTVVWCANAQGEGSPIITSSDGSNDALVWTAGAESSDALHAWDLQTGQLVFKGGAAADAIKNVRRFTSPIVVHGRIFVGGDGALYAMKP
jgi:outer membrane protein assembly factor BamB